MRKWLFILFILAGGAVKAQAGKLTTQDYTHFFKGFSACFILYDVNTQQIISTYNPENRCKERIAPDSTFKIPVSLMAFNEGLIHQKTIFHWDGKIRDIADWNQDLTPATWLKYSALWVTQILTPQLGLVRIQHYLAAFNYGNQDFSGDPGQNNGLTHAWLASSLKISAIEQLDFLKAMLKTQLPVSADAVNQTKKNLYLGTLGNGASYYGKTGSGRHGRNERQSHPSQLRDGWFVGFIEHDTRHYIFVSNLTDKKNPKPDDKAYGSALLKPVVLNILNKLFP